MYLPNCYFCLLGSLEPVWNLWQVSGAPKGRRCGLRFLWLPVPVLSGFFLAVHMCVLVAQSCRTVCGPMDYSPPGSSVHGILQTRILEWVAVSFSRGSSQPRDWTRVSCIAGRFFFFFFTLWATRKAPCLALCVFIKNYFSVMKCGTLVNTLSLDF